MPKISISRIPGVSINPPVSSNISLEWFVVCFPRSRFIEIDAQHTTLAMLSHAKYGYSDFGVNKKRVLRFIELLKHGLLKKTG